MDMITQGGIKIKPNVVDYDTEYNPRYLNGKANYDGLAMLPSVRRPGHRHALRIEVHGQRPRDLHRRAVGADYGADYGPAQRVRRQQAQRHHQGHPEATRGADGGGAGRRPEPRLRAAVALPGQPRLAPRVHRHAQRPRRRGYRALPVLLARQVEAEDRPNDALNRVTTPKGPFMLSQQETDLLCQVGPGTPMGEVFRRFWIPVLLSEELPEPDTTPVAIRILGEDLLAFRATTGKVGLTSAYCPHRHAHLFWGRNEEEGLRCTYHGWKYDTTGQCVDMPNEPGDLSFKDKIKLRSYPTIEAGGAIWAYMGPPERHAGPAPARVDACAGRERAGRRSVCRRTTGPRPSKAASTPATSPTCTTTTCTRPTTARSTSRRR